ncbi:MAG: hypothetical protein WCO00_04710 [Rhodospirillaceae bacterium]
MRMIIIGLTLLVIGCAGAATAPEEYNAILEQYCKLKFLDKDFNGCMHHMKTGYLTNDEVNFINEKTSWWIDDHDP